MRLRRPLPLEGTPLCVVPVPLPALELLERSERRAHELAIGRAIHSLPLDELRRRDDDATHRQPEGLREVESALMALVLILRPAGLTGSSTMIS